MSNQTGAAYSRDTEPMTKASSTTKTGWWRLLLAALAAALAVLLGAGTASAFTPPVAETRVGAWNPVVVNIVGPHECITAGQRWGHAPPQGETVVATGVAAKTIGVGERAVKAGVPSESAAVIRQIDEFGAIGESGVMGPSVPKTFRNSGSSGGQILPRSDANGALTYREWGTVPSAGNLTPGGERIVTGSNGSIYYSPDHYQTFIQVR